jgi:predicted nucleic acid-binding protein
MNAVDTNVLLYAHDPRDPAKQTTAVTLIQSLAPGILLWQVACEFLSASRKLEPFGYSQAQAWQDLRGLERAWTVKYPTWDVLDEAERLLNRYSLSFWDALLIGASLTVGVTLLYSEDFDAYPQINGLTIVNPFKGP